MTQHKNREKLAKCPINGCEYEGLSRSMHLHVRQSNADGHGPHGDIPDGISFDDLEKVGTKEVTMEYPEDRSEEETARLCPWCGQAFVGYRGVSIHVGQKAGSGVHPENAPEELEKEDCPVARVDDDMNVIELVEEGAIMPSTKRRLEAEEESVDKADVVKFIEGVESLGYSEIAKKARKELL